MKILDYMTRERVILSSYMGMGYLLGSKIGLLNYGSNLVLWKIAGIIVPLAHFILKKIIDQKADQHQWSKPNVVLFKGILTTAEWGMATLALATNGYIGLNFTLFCLATTALMGYCTMLEYDWETEIQSKVNYGMFVEAISDLSTSVASIRRAPLRA